MTSLKKKDKKVAVVLDNHNRILSRHPQETNSELEVFW